MLIQEFSHLYACLRQIGRFARLSKQLLDMAIPFDVGNRGLCLLR